MSDPYLGDVRAMSFTFVPQGWAQCAGQIMPVEQNRALFALLGNRFGGDGQSTFALPALPPAPTRNGMGMTYCISLRGEYPVR